MLLRKILILGCVCLMAGCATVAPQIQPVEAPVSQQVQTQAQQAAQLPAIKKYKRKIVIGRFTNETNYGRALLSDEEYQSMGRQVSDMLATRLIQSNRFLVFERPDLNEVKAEQGITNQKDLIGADTIIFGSLTEFGRSVTGKAGFLSSAVMQTAKATVEIRLVDTKTAQGFFSTTGSGQASTEQGDVAGFGNAAAYDSTLNDRAIAASISDLINNLIISLENRPWKTDILKVDGDQVYISGGKYQGIKEGDILFVMKKTGAVKSQQSGFTIDLPPEKVATIKVISLFGDSETNEGSQAQVIDGKIDPSTTDQLFVIEGE
jgi:curli biogenesis system outer membrane secretion channel CsgG